MSSPTLSVHDLIGLHREVMAKAPAEATQSFIKSQFYELETEAAIEVLSALGWKIDRETIYFFLKRGDFPQPEKRGGRHVWGPEDVQAVADYLAKREDAEKFMRPSSVAFLYFGIDPIQWIRASWEAGAPKIPTVNVPENFRTIIEPFRRDKAEVRFQKVG